MSGRNLFRDLTKDLSPQRQANIEARKSELREEMTLQESRKAIGASQELMAEQLLTSTVHPHKPLIYKETQKYPDSTNAEIFKKYINQ